MTHLEEPTVSRRRPRVPRYAPVSDIALVGIESRYVHELLDVLDRHDVDPVACLRSRHDTMIADVEQYEELRPWAERNRGTAFLVPLLTPGRRKRTTIEAIEAGLVPHPAVVDCTAAVSRTSVLGPGTVVNALAVVAAWCSIGAHTQINRSAAIGHDCIFAEYVSVGPNATLCGGCEIGAGVFIGAGATLLPNVCIGPNAVVGAGAVVTRSVPANAVVQGNPARVTRTGIAGFRDVGV